MSNLIPCPECGELLPPHAGSCACGWKAVAKPKSSVNTNCACGRFGIVRKDGKWRCGICSGVPPRVVGSHVSWRERWYQDRGLPYEPPFVGSVPSFRSVGRTAETVVTREPGEDLDERDVA